MSERIRSKREAEYIGRERHDAWHRLIEPNREQQ